MPGPVIMAAFGVETRGLKRLTEGGHMAIKQLAQDLYIIRGLVNVYVLETVDGLAVLDTGFPNSAPKILDGVRALGRRPGDVRHILLYRGRALLIGDVAHATTAHMGMGGGMALEDAVVLGQCVAGAATQPEALDAFMTRRFERVRSVVETSVRLSRLEQEKAPPSENQTLLTSAFRALAEPY
jgi:hypothetical protein